MKKIITLFSIIALTPCYLLPNNEKSFGIEIKLDIICLISIAIGILNIALFILAFTKKSKLIKKETIKLIKKSNTIRNEIQNIIHEQNSYPEKFSPSQKETIEQYIKAYIRSEEFKKYMLTTTASSQNASKTHNTESSAAHSTKPLHQIYARESKSMNLSNIHDTYQKGKSVYKLTMSEPNATKAEVNICIEQEEVKKRIIKFDNQYLEPICSVTRSSNEPTQVLIMTPGEAERIGEEWKVIKQIIVEIK